MNVYVDKIASCTLRAGLDHEVTISDRLAPERGRVIVVRALQDKTVYDKIELVSGRMAKVSKDDVIAGVLGKRRALRGFVGDIPDTVRVGDRLHILNIGGVLGVVISGHLDLGRPLLCEVLGAVERDGEPLSISRTDVVPPATLPDVPIVLVGGTCMNSGKTEAAATLVQKLTQRGHRVLGTKLTGVACQRDVLNMEDHGAKRTNSFLDAGLPSTIDVEDVAGIARYLLADLARDNPDVIIAELGDGIIGHYGVELILKDPEIRRRTRAHVMCANDLVGAWGAAEIMRSWGLEIDVFAGPATDNDVGSGYIVRELRVPAANARIQSQQLTDIVEELVN